ncbi:NADH:ubiquinone oxidoreductase [bacterium]|nr:NADH:ubiquinone oxidoreductase [bacterium]MBU1074121.1 NADH:ubiquinone oxidoreductase [bacterium]MBU1676465.1 NADH:ubiquinone oxidoreductase [bacterium]
MAFKPRVGVFDFTGCEGCELNHLNFEDQLLDILGHVDFVEWREAMDERGGELDIAFVEGSLSTPDCIKRIHEIRRRTKVLVAVGSCAVLGGINALKNIRPIADVREEVYGEDKYLFPTLPALPLSAVVEVDHCIRGCPMTQLEFLKVFTSLVMGKRPVQEDFSVCVECKLRENECVYGRGLVCLGPVTRAGCDAQCPTFGQSCIGCRGLVTDPRLGAMEEILVAHGLSMDEARRKLQLFNANQLERAAP